MKPLLTIAAVMVATLAGAQKIILPPDTPTEYNSVKKELVKVRNVMDEVDFADLEPTEKITSISYSDGLLRPLALVLHGATPVRHDIMQIFSYDDVGRIDRYLLPFASESSYGEFVEHDVHEAEMITFYNDPSDRVADDAAPFSVNVYDDSPLGFINEQGAVGTEWQPGTGHTRKKTFRKNNANEFRIWRDDLTSPGYYPQKELTVEEITDERGAKVLHVREKSGRLVQRHVQSETGTWLKTMYIYDQKGRVKTILQPEGVKLLGSATTISSQLQANQAFIFVYDVEDRIIEKKVPGVEPVYYCYDPLGRLVLIQDANLRTSNKWLYIKYDRQNRPVMQGLYTNTTHTTRSAVQQNVVDVLSYATGENFYERKQSGGTHGYSNNSFPTTGAEVLSVNYYDSYDLDANGTDDATYTAQGWPDETPAAPAFGRLTATKTKVLNTSNWIKTFVFYDRNGNVVQTRSNNHLSSIEDNLTTKAYDFSGRLVRSKTFHNGGGSNTVTIENRLDYDHAGRLLRIYQKNGSDAEVQIASYGYNDLGQMVNKNLHCTECNDEISYEGAIYAYNIARDEAQANGTELVAHNSVRLLPGFNTTGNTSFKARISSPAEQEQVDASKSAQSVDYRYNIRGWLTSINNAALTNDGQMNDDSNDFFGMELLYNETESGLNNQSGDERYWNGNISAIKWKGPGNDAGLRGQRAYRFKYDLANRLLSAKSQTIDITTWSTELNAFNEVMTYDNNGSIKTLKRNQRAHQWVGMEALYTSDAIDDLMYTYENNGQSNFLRNVDDAISLNAGFINGSTSTTAQEYEHDDAGNITRDENKQMTGIEYNVLGKVEQVTFASGKTVQYTYDASGNKLKMVLTDGATTHTTDYVGSFVYENGVLSYFGSPEGRVVKNFAGGWEYQYAISDHQGNTRVVFSSVTPAASDPIATFEGNASDESDEYSNVDPTNVVSHLSANQTTGGSKVVRMNQTYPVGPAKSVEVYPGDIVDMEVWTYYEGSNGWGSGNTNLTAFITGVAGAFGGSPTGTPEQQAIHDGIDFAYGQFGMGANQGDSRPSAYLNFILFDKDYNLLDMGWTVVPASANGSKQKMTIPSKKIEEHGFMYVYLSYEAESNQWVYFDDFKVTHNKSKILQYNEYYPFGLQTSTSWTRDGHTNNFLYNSASELNGNAGWYETFFRGYDPALGRFMQVDPLSLTQPDINPYHYVGNNPVLRNDPLGLNKDVTWEQLIEYINYLLDNGGGSWNRSDYEASLNAEGAGGGGGGPCPGCTVFGSGASYEAHDNGDGTVSLFVTSSNATVTADGEIYSGFTTLTIIDIAQTGGWPWPDPAKVGEWFARNFTDISSSDYPGIKIYESKTDLVSGAVTLPGFGIFVYRGGSKDKGLLQHEYGHFLDYMFSGDINGPSLPGSPNIPIVSFYLMIGVPSIFNAGTEIGGDHPSYWTEIRANQWAEVWFGNNLSPEFGPGSNYRFPTK